MSDKSQILTDHKKKGKKFIPPYMYMLGEKFKETSWVKQTLPELIWTALLNNRFGYQIGADLSLSLAKITNEIVKIPMWHGTISSYSSLTTIQKDNIKLQLQEINKLDQLSSGLRALNFLYPKSPLNFLNSKEIKEQDDKEAYLSELKNVIYFLYDKTSVEATFTQANAIYISFVVDNFRVTRKSSLANFPEIENYPNTTESIKIAAMIRASMNMFVGIQLEEQSFEWTNYFWNRGLEIDKCE